MNSKKKPSTYDITSIRAIIGLGNYGNKYYRTRHNIGFRVVDELVAQRFGAWHVVPKQEIAEIRLEGDPYDVSFPIVYVIKPLTYMNSSGRVVFGLLKKGIKAEEIVVVHDELEKPFEHVSLHYGGGAKGHNGLRSIIDVIGKNFWRLRFGIGRPDERDLVGDYVLAPFAKHEEQQIPRLLAKAVSLLVCGK